MFSFSMLFGLFKAVPKKIWVYLLILMAAFMYTYGVYNVGKTVSASECENNRLREQILISNEQSKNLYNKLIALDESVQSSIQFNIDKANSISNLETLIQESQKDSSNLKDILEGIKNGDPKNTDDPCSTLRDDYFELFKRTYNRSPVE